MTEFNFCYFRYHLGTLAFGSLVIAIVRMIRLVCVYDELCNNILISYICMFANENVGVLKQIFILYFQVKKAKLVTQNKQIIFYFKYDLNIKHIFQIFLIRTKII